MREKLEQYVTLLFAGHTGAEEIKEEILQNSLDRYDDLISQGKSPEAAYQLAIAGIGDIQEILGYTAADRNEEPVYQDAALPENRDAWDLNRIMRAAAIGLYILSPIPLFIMDWIGMDIVGLCGTLAIVAAATMILLLFRKAPDPHRQAEPVDTKEENSLRRSIGRLISVLGIACWLILSNITGAWYITWIVFPLAAAVKGLVFACLDLWEESTHER